MTLNITVGGYAELEEFCRQFLAGQASRKPIEGFQERAEELKEKVKEHEAEQPNPGPVIPDPAPAKAETTKKDYTPTPSLVAPAPAPEPAVYSKDELTKAAVALVDEGRTDELQAILAKFGTNSLPALSKEHYAAFAEELKALGAKL